MKKKSKWYYCCESNFFYGFKSFDEGEFPDPWDGSIYGPFETFTEAKKDAINYYQTDICYAREAIAEIRTKKQQK